MPRKHVTRSGLEKTLPGGNTDLCDAAENGSDEKVLTLLWKGASPNATDSTGKTALHLAAMQGFTSIVHKLLDYEASPFICDNSGHTPLDLALERNQREVVNLLCYTMNSSHIRNTYSWSSEQNSYSKVQNCNDNSLISAVRKRKEKFVREAIDAGSSLEEKDSDGNTALCLAATMGLHNIVHVLLDHGACVNVKNHYGRTALHMAAMRGVKRIVEILLVNNASPYERDANGLTPLDLACINNCKKVEKVLQNKLHTLMNTVNNGECADVEKPRLHLSENEQCLDSLGQAVRSNGCSLEKRNPDPQRKAVEIILPPTEPPQSQDREEPINIEDFNRFRKIAYVKKQTALIITAQHRARKRRFRLLQERRNYHAAKNYKILLKKYRERKKIHRDRIRQRAGMIKRMTIVQPTHQNTIQRKIEHAVDRAIKSGGRRAAYNAKKRAAQFEALLVASLEKKRQVRMITRTKKKKKEKKKKTMVQASVRNFPSMTEQSYGNPSVGPVPKQKLANSTAVVKTHTTKKNKRTRSMKSSTLRSNSTFVHKPVVSLECKEADVSGKGTKTVTYASLFPKSCVEEFPKFEQVKSEMIRQEKKENPMMPTSVKDKYEDGTIMKILIEDLLSAARERKYCKIYWKSLKKYKKERKHSDKQIAADYGLPNVQRITDNVTDLDLSGSSGGKENVPEYFEQDSGMACIDQNDSMLENVKNPTKKERECADKQKEVRYWIPNVQKSTDKVLTDFDISGPSGGAENVPNVLGQDAGTACINRNVSMSKRIMKAPKEKKVKPMGKKETRACAKDKNNYTNIPTKIHLDASESAIEDVSVQLNGNIDESAFDKNGATPIHIAARKKNGKDLALILKAGASADIRDKDGRTPLHEAALRGHSQNIRMLLQFGASIDVKENKFGSSPLHLASLRCQNECVKTLVEGGADMLIMDARGQTPLHVSAWNGHAACIDTLISLGTPVDTPCIDGSKTALHLATTKGHLECISLLLKKGAAVDSVDRAKGSVVHMATRERQADCLRFLLQNGASVNLKSGNTGSALHVAAIDGSEEYISILLESGASVDSRGRHFRTPLHVAAERGHHRCVKLLLDGGASVQSADNFMNTPLHLAAMGNHGEAVRLLVDAGASCSAKNNQRKTPLDVAGGDLVRSLLV